MLTEPIEVDLWLWPLDGSATPKAQLSLEEESRALRFVRPTDAQAYRAAHERMRAILMIYTGAAPDFRVNDHGKPWLLGGPSFNLSHSGGWAALAICREEIRLGVDIEALRPVERSLPDQFFAPAECATLAALQGVNWQRAFFRCWSRKEAFVKASGEGLSLPPSSFDVTVAEESPPALTRLEKGRVADWTLADLTLDDIPPERSFAGALAIEARGCPLVVRARGGRHAPPAIEAGPV